MPLSERPAIEGEEIEHCRPATSIICTYSPRAHLETLGAGDVDANVEAWLGQGLGQARLAWRKRIGAANEHKHIGWRRLDPRPASAKPARRR